MANEHWFNVLDTNKVLDLLRENIHEPHQLGSNPTYLPDEMFQSLIPVILIRHLVNAINSIYRTALQVTKQRPGDEDSL